MSILRLIIAWLMLAALPLQGFAAASMLLCGQGRAAATAHAGHDGHDGHDGHYASGAEHRHDAAHGDSDQADAGDPGDPDHKCPICALCQLAAIPESTPVLTWAAAPPADLPQPRALALTRAPPRPDKPPRA